MSKPIVKEAFIKCPNCGKKKNVNFTKKIKELIVTCFCGTHLKFLNK